MWLCQKCNIYFTLESIESHLFMNHFNPACPSTSSSSFNEKNQGDRSHQNQQKKSAESPLSSSSRGRLCSGGFRVFNCGTCVFSAPTFEGIAQHCVSLAHDPLRVRRGSDYDRITMTVLETMRETIMMMKSSRTDKQQGEQLMIGEQQSSPPEAQNLLLIDDSLKFCDEGAIDQQQSASSSFPFIDGGVSFGSAAKTNMKPLQEDLPLSETTGRSRQRGEPVVIKWKIKQSKMMKAMKKEQNDENDNEEDNNVDSMHFDLNSIAGSHIARIADFPADEDNIDTEEGERSMIKHNVGFLHPLPTPIKITTKIGKSNTTSKTVRKKGTRSMRRPRKPFSSEDAAVAKLTVVQPSLSSSGERCREYHCPLCSLKLRTAVQAARHDRIHTGEKPFPCRTTGIQCDKRFRSESDRAKHERIHTGVKPFQCSVCSKRFNESSNLRVHERIHSGERPFPCRICPDRKAFATAANRQHHENSHRNGKRPSKCRFCFRSYKTPERCQQHELKQHNSSGERKNLDKEISIDPLHQSAAEEIGQTCEEKQNLITRSIFNNQNVIENDSLMTLEH